MAFNYTADTVEILEDVGQFPPIACGSVVLSGWSATVTIRHFSKVKMAVASSQTANAARVSATSGNTFTITGTGTDRVDWFAVGAVRA